MNTRDNIKYKIHKEIVFDLTNVVKETIISQKSNDKDDDKSK